MTNPYIPEAERARSIADLLMAGLAVQEGDPASGPRYMRALMGSGAFRGPEDLIAAKPYIDPKHGKALTQLFLATIIDMGQDQFEDLLRDAEGEA